LAKMHRQDPGVGGYCTRRGCILECDQLHSHLNLKHMSTSTINLAEAKARLSELAELAAAGETVIITRRGKPIAQLTKPEAARHAIDLDALRRLTDTQPRQPESAGVFIRHMRDDSRY